MDPAVELKPVEGSKKQKRRTVMEGKPQKNRKILEEELEWHFSPEGGVL
jgi:hypothetical protein